MRSRAACQPSAVIIGQHDGFAGARGNAGIDDVGQQALGRDVIGAAGPDDLQCLRHRCRAEGCRGDGRRPAAFIDAADAGQPRHDQGGGIDMRVGAAGCQDRYLRHAGDHGGNGRHHRHAGKGAFAARHVAGDGIDRRRALAGEDAGAQFLHPELLRQLGLMKAADAVDGEFDRLDELAIEAVDGTVDFGLRRRDAVSSQRRMIEFAGKASQRLVAFLAHGFDHRPRLVDIGAEIGFGALEKLRALGCGKLREVR